MDLQEQLDYMEKKFRGKKNEREMREFLLKVKYEWLNYYDKV
jgi:hypothetical protein